MLVVILLYDQLLFRPLLAWSRKFQGDPDADADNPRPWFLMMLQRAQVFDLLQSAVLALNRGVDHALAGSAGVGPRSAPPPAAPSAWLERGFDLTLMILLTGCRFRVGRQVHPRDRGAARDRLGRSCSGRSPRYGCWC